MEEISKAIECYNELIDSQHELSKKLKCSKLVEWLTEFNRLLDLKNSKKLIELTFNYGDYVWIIKSEYNKQSQSQKNKLITAKIAYISFGNDGLVHYRAVGSISLISSYLDTYDITFKSSDIGKTVFASMKAAEYKLSSINNE